MTDLPPLFRLDSRPGPLGSIALVASVLALAQLVGCARDASDSRRVSPLADRQHEAHGAAFDKGEPASILPGTRLAAGRLAESRGDFHHAAQQYRQILREHPGDREALHRLGVLLSRELDPEAIGVWRQYITATGGSATAWANLGFCHEMLGEPAEAEAAYQRGLARDPRNPHCRINYGMLLARRGDVAGAEAQLTVALAPAQAWFNIGAAREAERDIAGAIAAYRKSLIHEPDLAAARQRVDSLAPGPDSDTSPAGRRSAPPPGEERGSS